MSSHHTGTPRRRADAERSIARILDAALDALASDPEASMAEIARRAGVVRATIYVHFPTREALLEKVLTAAKKDLTIQRYKGLGEMNPEQLWETTMNPDKRTLLEVRIDDMVETDQIFTVLMGDAVEPRRKFIEDNALDVRNLDV